MLVKSIYWMTESNWPQGSHSLKAPLQKSIRLWPEWFRLHPYEITKWPSTLEEKDKQEK